jgi:DNA-binding transcriptional ArsR family regulator
VDEHTPECLGGLVDRSITGDELIDQLDRLAAKVDQLPGPALRALADESRRTMLDTLTAGPATAGELAALLPIARPGVSRHLRVLRVLREAGLVEARQEAQRRVCSLPPEPLAEVEEWLGRYRALWEQRLDALHTEIARGKRERRSTR